MGIYSSQFIVLVIIVILMAMISLSKIKIQGPLDKKKYLLFATIYPVFVNIFSIAYCEVSQKVDFIVGLYTFSPLIFNIMLFPPLLSSEISKSDLRRLLILGIANSVFYTRILSEYMNSEVFGYFFGITNFFAMIATAILLYYALRNKLNGKESREGSIVSTTGIVMTVLLYISFGRFQNDFSPELMLGKDENKNTIRDDVESWIKDNRQNVPALSNAFRQMAFYHSMAVANINSKGRMRMPHRKSIEYDYYLRQTSFSCLHYVCENALPNKDMVNTCKEQLIENFINLLNNTWNIKRAMRKIDFDQRYISSYSRPSATDCEFDLESNDFEYIKYYPEILIDQKKLLIDFKKHLNKNNKRQAKAIFHDIRYFTNFREEYEKMMSAVFRMSDYEILEIFENKFFSKPFAERNLGHLGLTAKDAYELTDDFLIEVMKNKKEMFKSFYVRVDLLDEGYENADLIEFYIFAKKLNRLKALLPTYAGMIDKAYVTLYIRKQDKQYSNEMVKLLNDHGIKKITWQTYR